MPKLKVVYIHHSYYFGGSSKSLGLLILELLKKNIEAHIICPEGPVVDYFKNNITPNVYPLRQRSFPITLPIVHQKFGYFHFIRNLRNKLYQHRVIKVLNEIKPDLVHCNEWGLADIAKQCKLNGYPVVVHARTMPEPKYCRVTNYSIAKLKKYCDHLICITGSVQNALKSISKSSIVYNPIENIKPEKSFNKEKTNLNFLSLSAIQKNKGVFDILKTAQKLEKDKRIKINIAGKVSPIDVKNLSLIKKTKLKFGILHNDSNVFLKMIEDNKIRNVELLGHISDISSILKNTDVLIAPMHLNAPPRSVVEAGIFGIPSILSMKDKVEDVIEHEVNGILIDEQSPDQLTEAILKLANDSNLRQRLGQEARKKFEVNNNPEIIATQVFEIYKSVLNKS